MALLSQEAEKGLLFPRFSAIQEVSASLTCEVARFMVGRGSIGRVPKELAGQSPPDWEAFVASKMYKALPTSKL